MKNIGAERLSPEEFLKLLEEDRDSIESVKYIPPRLGIDNHFGKYEVVRGIRLNIIIDSSLFDNLFPSEDGW